MVEQRKLIQESINGTRESVPAILHFPLDKSFGALAVKLITLLYVINVELKTAA